LKIHLHGHDFALLEQAYNKTFNVSTMKLKLDNPPRRDVVLLPGGWKENNTTPSTKGYVVIAFKADNPGPWLVHCHIATHISMGLGMSIMEAQGIADRMWPQPNDSSIVEAQRVCTNWKIWEGNPKNWAPNKCTEKDPNLCFQDDSGV
jgi:Multicopper oxidase